MGRPRKTIESIIEAAEKVGDCLITHSRFPTIGGIRGVKIQRHVYTRYIGTPPYRHIIFSTCGSDLCVNINHIICKTKSDFLSITRKGVPQEAMRKTSTKWRPDRKALVKALLVKKARLITELKQNLPSSLLARCMKTLVDVECDITRLER